LRHTVKWIAYTVAALLLSSCTTMEQPGPAQQGAPQDVTDNAGGAADEAATRGRTGPLPDQAPEEQAGYQPSEPTIYRGTDQVFRRPQAQPPVKLYGDAVTLNFEQAPLTEVVHAILGDILELDYIVEHPINGQVTLRTRSPVPREQLLDILESLLRANRALMVRDSEGRFFVSASGQMSKLHPGVAASAEQALGYSTIIIPLQYISAKNMAEILRPVSDENTFVRIDNLRNLLMLAGTRAQLQGFQEIIETFDVDLLKGMSVGIFPIENTSIEEVDAALNVLLGKDGDSEVEALSGIGSVVKIIPVQRLNSVMVVTSRAHYLERIEQWIERLDREPDANFERRLYVYPVQNTNAGHLAGLLSTIFSGSGVAGGSDRAGGSGVAPGFTPETVSSGGGEGSAQQGSGGRAAGRSSGRSNFTVGQVKVVADEENNALLIYATGKEYGKIKPALERLDIPATQVIIEASIIEVTLSDDLQYGLEWTFDNDLWDDFSGEGQLLNSTSGLTPNVPGFAYSFIGGSGQIKAVLNALAEDSLLNVISSPSVMVLDNQTASIQVGDQIPVSSGSTVTDVGTTQLIQYRDTGVQLSVTPSVNAGAMVTMDVEQSVTDVGPLELAGGTANRTFLERKITSKVAVRSGESVVLGGLIRENKSEGSSGLPFLHSLPVIGALFGTKSTESDRTELLVVITPRVIFGDGDLREVSREMRRQMRGLDLIDISQSSSFLMDRDVDPTPEDPGVDAQP